VLIAVGLIVMGGEFLIMLLIGRIPTTTLLKDSFLEKLLFYFLDPIALTAIVSPALYLLIFRPLNHQAELGRQLDELRGFQRLSIGRELRIKELVKEVAALRSPLFVEPVGAIPVTSGTLEKPHNAAEQSATQPTEESQRSALLFMLEDLEAGRKKIEQSHHEWISALDVVNDPIFLHDEQFRILRCNKAYQQRAGIPFHELIGQPYYEVFPKNHEPLPSCLRVMENAVAVAEEEEVLVGDAIYRSRAFSIHDEQGAYLHSVHILEDITERKRAESKLAEQIEELRRWHDVTSGREERILDLKHEINELLGSVGQPPRYPSAESEDPQEK
jgi:PAS domain S-box-containing protein